MTEWSFTVSVMTSDDDAPRLTNPCSVTLDISCIRRYFPLTLRMTPQFSLQFNQKCREPLWYFRVDPEGAFRSILVGIPSSADLKNLDTRGLAQHVLNLTSAGATLLRVHLTATTKMEADEVERVRVAQCGRKAYLEDVQWVEQEERCAICLRKLTGTKVVEMMCKHRYHLLCVVEWLLTKPTCPTCRFSTIS